MDSDEAGESLRRIREIRTQLRAHKSDGVAIDDPRESPAVGAGTDVEADHSPSSSPAPRKMPETSEADSDLDAIRIRYEMELAAHRETTEKLLAEKDRTIAALEQLVAEVQSRRV